VPIRQQAITGLVLRTAEDRQTRHSDITKIRLSISSMAGDTNQMGVSLRWMNRMTPG